MPSKRKTAPTRPAPSTTPKVNVDQDGDDVVQDIFNRRGSGSKVADKQAEFHAAVAETYSKLAITMKSVLNKRQVADLVRGLVFAERYESRVMLALVNGVLEVSVSVERGEKTTGSGRHDLRQIIASLIRRSEDERSEADDIRTKLLGH